MNLTTTTTTTRCRRRPGRRAAFTLIELLLVLVILVVLAGVVVVNFAGKSDDARNAAAKQDIAALGVALDAFEVDNSRYPLTQEGLQALTTPIADAKDPSKWPYLKKTIGNDPWGRPYVYKCPGDRNPNGYDLYSVGRDGREASEDDVGNW